MTTYYPQFLRARLLYDSDRSGIAADDVDVTNWTKTSKFILATQIGYNGRDTAASAYKLQWRDVTDGGAFDGSVAGEGGDVASTGEIKWAATSAVLADGNAVDDAGDDRRCTAATGQTWQDGLENVNDNTLPDSGTFDLGSDCYTELQWALDPADADDGHAYEFQLWNTTSTAATGTAACTITMAVGRRIFVTHQ